MKVLTIATFIVLLCLVVKAESESWRNVGTCGKGLNCGPQCQLWCLEMHNYYRKLHDSPPLSCDHELAKSAQKWVDQQAEGGKMYHSEWTDKYTESISWKGWGWRGMDDKQTAIQGAAMSWYSEIKNDYNYNTDKETEIVGHFKTLVWASTTKLGCGIKIKPNDGTYVTAHYAPASHVHSNSENILRENVKPRAKLAPQCEVLSTHRELCDESLKAPKVTPNECVLKGCCYDDMFLSEPSVKFYSRDGRKWCFKAKNESNV